MIWLHIRSAGNWTNRVYDHFANYMDDTSEVAADNGKWLCVYVFVRVVLRKHWVIHLP